MSDGNESDVVPSRIVARMGRLDNSDMGQGRKGVSGQDSSSSRESSPRNNKGQKRSFTPTSDDGDLVVPPVEDDDTPPPEGPILRQAVAFSDVSMAAPQLNTYQAAPPPRLTAIQNYFLPGQEVPFSTPIPPPPPPPPPRGTQGAKKKRKTHHFNDGFSDKTGSFRVRGYINDPKTSSVKPPTHFGTGPYASLFRASISGSPASGSQSTASPEQPPTEHASPRSNGIARTAASLPVALTPIPAGPSVHHAPPSTVNSSSPDQLTTTSTRNSTTSSRAATSTSQTSKRSRSNAKASSSKTGTSGKKAQSSSQRNLDKQNSSSSLQSIPEHLPPPTTSGTSAAGRPHYRRDYDNNRDYALDPSSPSTNLHASSGISSQHSTRPESSSLHSSSPSPSMSETLSQITSQNQISHSSSMTSQSRGPNSIPSDHCAKPHRPPDLVSIVRTTRMVTLLIEDIRSGVSDHQLTEVKVPLRTADDPEDGFWADARDVSQAIQSSPSRIDGPAKVYTLRGKYRQFFLRVSADNVDEFMSANLIVTKFRTLDIVVEANLPPDGNLPSQPQIPHKLIRVPPAEYNFSPSSQHSTSKTKPRNQNSNRQKRRHSSSSSDDGTDAHSSQRSRNDEHDAPTPTSSSSSSSPNMSQSNPSTSVNVPPKKKRSYRIGSPRDRIIISSTHSPTMAYRGQDDEREGSPLPDASPEEVDEAISTAIQTSIVKDKHWKNFIKLKAIPPPLSVSQVLEQYRFVQRKVDEWEGKLAPFKSSRPTVHKSHVLKALNMDSRWGSDCTETLDLLELYGPGGQRHEDPRIAEMINDTGPKKGRPAKRFLRLLRDIDNDWSKEHQPHNNIRPEQRDAASRDMEMG